MQKQGLVGIVEMAILTNLLCFCLVLPGMTNADLQSEMRLTIQKIYYPYMQQCHNFLVFNNRKLYFPKVYDQVCSLQEDYAQYRNASQICGGSTDACTCFEAINTRLQKACQDVNIFSSCGSQVVVASTSSGLVVIIAGLYHVVSRLFWSARRQSLHSAAALALLGATALALAAYCAWSPCPEKSRTVPILLLLGGFDILLLPVPLLQAWRMRKSITPPSSETGEDCVTEIPTLTAGVPGLDPRRLSLQVGERRSTELINVAEQLARELAQEAAKRRSKEQRRQQEVALEEGI